LQQGAIGGGEIEAWVVAFAESNSGDFTGASVGTEKLSRTLREISGADLPTNQSLPE
jgi:hypothetical protein